ncbi:hypothetical protein NEIRO03_2097 [Nematocida sp. AWRm78]|nr:hypothetical protein NEIRO03_2097 [Nematocida sp. AWRm78]
MRIRKEIIMLFILFTALYASAALPSADEVGPDGKKPEEENLDVKKPEQETPQGEKPGIFKRIGNFIKRTYLRVKNSLKKKKSGNNGAAPNQPKTGSVNEESFVMVGFDGSINNSAEKSLVEEEAPTAKDQPPASTLNNKNEDDGKEKKPAEEAKKPAEEAKKPGEEAKKPAEEAKKPGEEAKKPAEEAKKPGEEAKKPAEEAKKPAEEMGSNPKQPVAGEKQQA